MSDSAAILKDLKQAEKRELATYIPYYDKKRQRYLPWSMSLYQHKSLEGARKIEGGEDIPFVATWNTSMLPADLTRCRVMFEHNADLTYEVMMPNYEFMKHLIQVVYSFKHHHVIDFSQEFYKKLLHME